MRRELEDLAQEYLGRAERLLRPPDPGLVAIGGLSGSGKSTLSLALAPLVGAVPGAIVIRSDEVRKRICGVSPLAHLGPEGYAPDVSRKVYARAADQARRVLRAGHATIVDAVFARPEDREAIARVAAAERVPFTGLWLDAPPSIMMERAARRTSDVSDADSSVVAAQAAEDVGPIAWGRLNAEGTAESVLEDAVRIVAPMMHAGREVLKA